MQVIEKSVPYTPVNNKNQMVYGDGTTIIICGWTPRSAIARKLDKSLYAAIGQLYSPARGINFLIRNLLMNPQSRRLVILNATKEDKTAGGCQCLNDFFVNGFEKGVSDVGRECWIIKSSVKGYIDLEVPRESLEILRQSIVVDLVESISDCVKIVDAIASFPTLPAWGAPQNYPILEVMPKVVPGHRYGHRIEGKTIADTWVKILHRIMTTGTIRPNGYDQKWQELIDLVAVVTDEPEEFYFPDPNYLPCDREFIREYVPHVLDDAPYQEGVKYTYGQRLRSWFERDQIEQVINKLIGEIDAASAVMSLWDVKDHEKGGSPCLNHIWVRVVDNELSLTATFRSNDMFGAWPSNAMGLRALQKHIRDAIALRSDYDLKMGPLITISQSAHIYSDCWENAEKTIEQNYYKILNRELHQFNDPVGNFLIEVKGDRIIAVQRTTNQGESVAKYEGKSAIVLGREIIAESPAIHPTHALYLGRELARAEECLKSGSQFVQS